MTCREYQRTSLEAYKILEPELGDRQQLVLTVINSQPNISNHEISNMLGIPINSITPRVYELRDMGLVVCSGHKIDSITKRNVMTWNVVK